MKAIMKYLLLAIILAAITGESVVAMANTIGAFLLFMLAWHVIERLLRDSPEEDERDEAPEPVLKRRGNVVPMKRR